MNIKIESGAKVQITDKPIVNVYGNVVQKNEFHIRPVDYQQESEDVEYEGQISMLETETDVNLFSVASDEYKNALVIKSDDPH